jgi:actin-like ATPase involved in cell morphogenesis
MGWTLAVDFGTTATAAAIHDGDTELLEVDGSARLPSLVMLAADGGIIVGNTAHRQAATAPERVERTPKRRLGDPVVLLGEEAVEPTDLVAAILRHVAAEAMRRQGGTRPDQVVLTHPVSWAGARLAALRDAARRADLGDVTLLSEPVAAALHLGDDRIEVGAHVAVYDLGGGTFDVAVLRRTASGFEPVGTPGGDDQLGGEDFDQLLYEEVGERIAEQDPQVWSQLRTADERSWIRANAALRDEVRVAKEALSSSPEYTIYVGAPADLEVVITRERFEDLVREQLGRTVDELVATVDRAGLALTDVAAVHLVGGSSRIPLVTRLLSERTGLVPTTWGDPKASVALGAAARMGAPAPVVLAPPAGDDTAVVTPDATAVSEPAVQDLHDGDERRGSRRRRTLVLAAVGAMLLLIGALAVVLGSDDPERLDAVTAGDAETTTTDGGRDAAPASDDIVIDFGASEVEGVTSSRTWTLDPTTDVLTNELAIGTTASERVERTHIEVIPKELAADVADLTFSPAYTSVVQADPVVRYDLVIEPEQKVKLAWSVKTPDGLTEKQLGSLSKKRNVAEETFYAELAKLGGEGSENLLLGTEPAQNDTPTIIDQGGSDDGGPVGPIETTSTTSTTTNPTTTTTSTTTTTAKQYTIPGAPTNVLVRDPSGDIGAVSVTLTWSAPSNTGGGLSGYRLTAQAWGYDFVDGDCVGSLKPLGSQVQVDRGAGTSTTVQLGEQTAYACSWVVWTIRSVNAVGQTSASAQARGLVPSSIVSYRHTRAISGRAYAQTNCEANPGLCAARGSTIVAGTYVGAA